MSGYLFICFFTADLSAVCPSWAVRGESPVRYRDVERRGRGQGERCCHGRPRLCFTQHRQRSSFGHHRVSDRLYLSCQIMIHDYDRVEKEPESKGETVDEVSDVSSNELSGPEDGECESGNGEC